jgi:hypothetical protein
MRRDQLAHLLRAASQIVGERDVVVIGSQSILGSYRESELPDPAVGSIEADLAFLDDPDNSKSDQVDAAIGEDSQFHATYGYYGQGVSVATATLPAGWRDRVVVLEDAAARPGRGLCLDPHDLVVSKLVRDERRTSRSRGLFCPSASWTQRFLANVRVTLTPRLQCNGACWTGSTRQFNGWGRVEAPTAEIWGSSGRRLLAGLAVDRLAQQVGVAVVPRVLLDHVAHDPSQARCPTV